jgi:hypothetical protein
MRPSAGAIVPETLFYSNKLSYNNNFYLGESSMNTAGIPPLNARLCRAAGWLAVVSGAAFLLGDGFLWFAPDPSNEAIRVVAHASTGLITVTPQVRIMGFGLTASHLAILVWGLWTARALFRRFAAGEVFEAETGVLLRRFGKALLIYAALTPFVNSLALLIVTAYNPSGEKMIGFGLSDHEIVLGLVGVLILVTGSVMADAARIAADNRQIV